MTNYLEFKADLSDPDIAAAFDDFTYWSSMFGQLLFRHLRYEVPLTALDVGCATGFPLLELADRLGPDSPVHGIDSWESAAERARMKAKVRGQKNIHMTVADAADMPFDDDTFDLIVSNLGVNNVAQPSTVMSECYRVCRPGGRLALTSNLVGHMREFYEVYELALTNTGNSNLIRKLHDHVAHRATTDGLKDLFANAGFEKIEYFHETFTLRYADGSSFLRAYLSRLGFLDGWRSILAGTDQETVVFEELETQLNRVAEASDDGLLLTIPAVYIEGTKIDVERTRFDI